MRVRFKIEHLPGMGEITVRLPFRLGISFWEPHWACMFGIKLNDIGIEWALGPFAGEMWREFIGGGLGEE